MKSTPKSRNLLGCRSQSKNNIGVGIAFNTHTSTHIPKGIHTNSNIKAKNQISAIKSKAAVLKGKNIIFSRNLTPQPPQSLSRCISLQDLLPDLANSTHKTEVTDRLIYKTTALKINSLQSQCIIENAYKKKAKQLNVADVYTYYSPINIQKQSPPKPTKKIEMPVTSSEAAHRLLEYTIKNTNLVDSREIYNRIVYQLKDISYSIEHPS